MEYKEYKDAKGATGVKAGLLWKISVLKGRQR